MLILSDDVITLLACLYLMFILSDGVISLLACLYLMFILSDGVIPLVVCLDVSTFRWRYIVSGMSLPGV